MNVFINSVVRILDSKSLQKLPMFNQNTSQNDLKLPEESKAGSDSTVEIAELGFKFISGFEGGC